VSNMNGPTRKKKYIQLVKRDGEFCRNCKKYPPEVNLVIDHIDNNNRNNFLDNLQLLCRSHNYFKDPRRPLDECVSEDENPTEISINRTKEPCFRKYAYERMDEDEFIRELDLIDSGAEHCGVSSETARRYLRKMCSSEGKFERYKRVTGWIIKYKEDVSDI
jgi:hypothetical protein